ncbi:MAG: hypothetical protein AB8H79_14045 [Myxococcota bacterium]
MSVLHLPADLDLDLDDEHSLVLRYPGSLHLAQTFGRAMASVHVGGNLVLDLDEVNGICVAGGSLTTTSPVEATRLTAGTLLIGSGVVRAAALAASEKIIIGKCTLKVDVIIAPIIEIHPEAKGRVTVIESRNDRGPTKIKGGFTLQEYEELFGDSEEFLADRSVCPLDRTLSDMLEVTQGLPLEEVTELEAMDAADDLDDPPTELSTIAPPGLDDVFAPTEVADDDDSYDGVGLTLDAPTILAEPTSAAAPDPSAADIDNEDSEIIKQVRPLPPRAPTPMPPPKRSRSKRTSKATQKWFDRFDGILDQLLTLIDEPSEPLVQLHTFAQERQVEGIEQKLDTAWLGTLRQHRQARTPVDAKVSHRFRVLSDLVAHGPK